MQIFTSLSETLDTDQRNDLINLHTEREVNVTHYTEVKVTYGVNVTKMTERGQCHTCVYNLRHTYWFDLVSRHTVVDGTQTIIHRVVFRLLCILVKNKNIFKIYISTTMKIH